MAFEEKRAWVFGLVTVVSYGAYLAFVLGQGQGQYVAAVLWAVGAAIVGAIGLNILVAVVSPEGANVKDQRDREIHRFGSYVGQAFLVLGGVAGMVLAMARVEPFWIANAIYLGFVLSALLASAAKIVAYRWGFQPW